MNEEIQDTADDKLRAERDALRDMLMEIEAEVEEKNGGGTRYELKEKFVKNMRVQFIASYYMKNNRCGEEDHGIIKHVAASPEEAIGKMYVELVETYDYDEGWSPPSIILDDEPMLLVPGVGMPLGVDLKSIFDEIVEDKNDAEAECPTCGDPMGQCKDPDDCVQNPNNGRGYLKFEDL